MTRGRPRGFKEDDALDAAMMLFWRKGFRSTSLDDLVAETKMPRASLYQVFGDKRALFIRCLDLYGDRFSGRMHEIMAAEPNGKRALAQILNASADRLTSSAGPPGCLRCDATVELMGSDAALDEAIAGANEKYRRNIELLCKRAVDNRELKPELAGRLPIFVASMIAGMVTIARGGASRDELAILVDQVLLNWPDPVESKQA